MPIRFDYDNNFIPAMPIAQIVVRHREKQVRLSALLDSGADGTMIPRRILQEINAPYQEQLVMRGVTGESEIVDTYLVVIEIGPYTTYGIQAIAIGDYEEAIIGRDVMNNLVITLDGLAQETIIAD
jgi:predicted aspartyl protease